MILTADRVVLPAGLVEPGWVETSGDRVTGAGGGTPPAPVDRHLARNPRPRLRRPALPRRWGCGLHHGRPRRGRDGHRDAPRPRHDLARGQPRHRHRGTPRRARCGRLAPLVRSGELAGIHLEGPWLSAAHCGAHDPALLRAPDPAEVARLLDAGDGTVRMVTLAPELDHGLEAVGPARRPRRHRRAGPHRRDATHVARAALDGRRHGRRPTCSTRCARCTTASPGRCSRSSEDPRVVRRADRRRRPPAPRGAALGADVGTGPLPPGHRRDGRRRARPTATTCSARPPCRCATAWPGWPRTAPSPAAP